MLLLLPAAVGVRQVSQWSSLCAGNWYNGKNHFIKSASALNCSFLLFDNAQRSRCAVSHCAMPRAECRPNTLWRSQSWHNIIRHSNIKVNPTRWLVGDILLHNKMFALSGAEDILWNLHDLLSVITHRLGELRVWLANIYALWNVLSTCVCAWPTFFMFIICSVENCETCSTTTIRAIRPQQKRKW